MSSYYKGDYDKGPSETDKQYEERAWPGMGEYPPPAFYFVVKFPDLSGSMDTSFQEVSGIGQEMEVEDVAEGGENQFVHHLPKAPKYQRLVLKRGVVPSTSRLVQWCTSVLGGVYPISTGSIEVSLMNLNGSAIRTWAFSGAYPVKWQVGELNSTKNDVAIETIELCYRSFTREM